MDPQTQRIGIYLSVDRVYSRNSLPHTLLLPPNLTPDVRVHASIFSPTGGVARKNISFIGGVRPIDLKQFGREKEDKKYAAVG